MYRTLIAAFATAVISLVASDSVQAISITTADGVAGADSWIQSGTNSGNNNGLSPQVQIKNENNDGSNNSNRKGYFRFDLSGQPAGMYSNGLFELSFTDPINELGGNSGNLTYTFNLFALDDGDAGENWGETTITWDNAPANDSNSGNGVLSNATLLGTLSPGVTGFGTAGQTLSFSGASLDNFLNSDTDGQATFIVTRLEEGSSGNEVVHIFESGEGTSAAPFPTLSFDIAGVPEPTSAALCGMAALCSLGFTRRRRR